MAKPNPFAVARASSLYLAPAFSRAPSDFFGVSLVLQLVAIDRAVARAKAGDPALSQPIKAFRDRLTDETPRSVRSEVFSAYYFMAEASGSPVLDCIMRTFVFPLDFERASAFGPAERRNYRQNQLRMLEAIEAGDAPRAKRQALDLRRQGAAFGPRPIPAADIAASDETRLS